MLASLNLMRVCISVLVECYSDRKNEERGGNNQQRPRKFNNLVCFFLHPLRAYFRKSGKSDGNEGVFLKNYRNWKTDGKHWRSILNFFQHSFHVFLVSVKLFKKFFCFRIHGRN